MHHRIWQEPGDTTIKITCYADDSPETAASANRSLLEDGRIHPAAEFLDTDQIETVLPSQRRFWDDSQLVGGIVIINRDKAEARVLADVRVERDRALVASDVALLRAQEVKSPKVPDLIAYRESLRNLPEVINLQAFTLDELANYQAVLPVAP